MTRDRTVYKSYEQLLDIENRNRRIRIRIEPVAAADRRQMVERLLGRR